MNKDSTVPTAVAFIGILAIAAFCFFVIRNKVNQNNLEKEEQESREVGKLANLKVAIGGVSYTATSESTKAVESFLNQLPLELEMNDSGNGLKRGYTYFKLATSAKKLGTIEAGDILLSGDSYVLIATKTFKSSDKYTKIGHISNLKNVPSGPVRAIITKGE